MLGAEAKLLDLLRTIPTSFLSHVGVGIAKYKLWKLRKALGVASGDESAKNKGTKMRKNTQTGIGSRPPWFSSPICAPKMAQTKPFQSSCTPTFELSCPRLLSRLLALARESAEIAPPQSRSASYHISASTDF